MASSSAAPPTELLSADVGDIEQLRLQLWLYHQRKNSGGDRTGRYSYQNLVTDLRIGDESPSKNYSGMIRRFMRKETTSPIFITPKKAAELLVTLHSLPWPPGTLMNSAREVSDQNLPFLCSKTYSILSLPRRGRSH